MNNDEDKTIRVGSRKSELALIQTKHVISLLQKLYPNKKFEIHTMSTIGDRVLNVSLPKIGEKSLFTRDLEDALRTGGVDFVVHSLKDLPTSLPTGMAIGAVLEREDARDALVLRENYKEFTLQTLPPGCVIGTSSLRRTAQLRRQYPHLTVCDIRGNLNTRLAKLDAVDSKFAGIILAQAGLVRMGWQSRISQVLEPDHLLYAVGQGALAVECRANDSEILDMLRQLMCLPTTCRILAERSFLKTLGGGCSAPVAVVSKLNGHVQLDAEHNFDETQLELEGAVWSLNGDTEIREEMACKLVAVVQANKRLTAGKSNGNATSIIDGPPHKRTRQLSDSAEVNDNENSESPKRRSPPVINDDIEVSRLADSYDLKELIEKHIDLAKKCPVVGHEAHAKHDKDNGNLIPRNTGGGGGGGGGDADCLLKAAELPTTSGNAAAQHCPLQIDVGQDFMGQCPFVDNETKVSMASAGKCPITGKDQLDRAVSPTTAAAAKNDMPKCPFTGAHQKSAAAGEPANNKTTTPSIVGSHAKCPFLQKTVEMFDYEKEEHPSPRKYSIFIEEVDDLFCGLYQHRCHSRDLYVKSRRLGQQLAENLIKKGALEVMRAAQDEIHSKIS